MELLKDTIGWLVENGDRAAFWGYLGSLALLGWIESRVPASLEPRHRQARWPTNFGIGLLNIGLAMLAPVTGVIAAKWARDHGVGLLNMMYAGFWLTAAVTVLARSLAGYVFHLLMHKVGLFWRVHRVHHSDTHLDVSTSLRSHPLELVMLFLTLVPLAIVLGLDPWVLAAFELSESVIAAFSHTNTRLPESIDRMLRRLFVTPNMHCLHHSSWQPETDSNYGQVFSFWDRLFGTYTAAPRKGYDAMQIGLQEVDFEHAADVVWQLKSPALRDYSSVPFRNTSATEK